MKRHYVYIITNELLAKYYFGVRSCTGAPDEDVTYWGSSKVVNELRAAHPEGWQKKVLEEHRTRQLAEQAEDVLIAMFMKEPGCLNRARTLRLSIAPDKFSELMKQAHVRHKSSWTNAQKRKWADPEYAAWMQAKLQAGRTPDQARNAAMVVANNPELLAKRNAAIKAAWDRRRDEGKAYWYKKDPK